MSKSLIREEVINSHAENVHKFAASHALSLADLAELYTESKIQVVHMLCAYHDDVHRMIRRTSDQGSAWTEPIFFVKFVIDLPDPMFFDKFVGDLLSPDRHPT